VEGAPRAGELNVKDSPLYPILYMIVLSAVFGAVVSSLAVATRARVTAGENAQFRRHVLSAFGLEPPQELGALERFWGARVQEKSDDEGVYYVARSSDGSLIGYGFPFTGPGFWGPISGIAAVSPQGKELLGVSFTRHQETPGLGGRITEQWFRAQFRGKALDHPPGGGPILDFVYRQPRGPREVEAITGATQTSTRLGRFLNRFLHGLSRRQPFRAGGTG
jgi:Na+-transporting NADH:ubiquinone oxidoreductase subunit C